jgi:hypothetical protein
MKVVPVEEMDDETLLRHFEARHADDLKLKFPESGPERHLNDPKLWRTYHQTMHRLYPRKYEHSHRDVNRG